jgi:hypothetical protein
VFAAGGPVRRSTFEVVPSFKPTVNVPASQFSFTSVKKKSPPTAVTLPLVKVITRLLPLKKVVMACPLGKGGAVPSLATHTVVGAETVYENPPLERARFPPWEPAVRPSKFSR